MTDKRNDDVLESAINALPAGCGIVFRHYHLEYGTRKARFESIRKLAKKRHHLVLLADKPQLARKWSADGVHGRGWTPLQTNGLIHSAPVHSETEIRLSNQNRADIFVLSPVFATRSHPGAKPLNAIQLHNFVQLCNGPVVLLGGMNSRRFAQMRHLGAHGWAAIDALSNSNLV